MANKKEWMGTVVLQDVKTGMCNIGTPDTTYYTKTGQKKTKPPQWKMEIRVDRENKQMMDLFTQLHAHVSQFEDIAEGAEPWVRTRKAYSKQKDDGTTVEYPEYEYLSALTTKNPHADQLVVDANGQPYTDEVWNNSTISIALSPKYDDVHNYLITFYIDGVKVTQNGSGGGGGGDRSSVMKLLNVPFGDSSEPAEASSSSAPFSAADL